MFVCVCMWTLEWNQLGTTISTHTHHFHHHITDGQKGHQQAEKLLSASAQSYDYLYEDSLSIIVRLKHALHHREGDSEAALWSLHFHCHPLLPLCSNEPWELPGVALQLSVSELIEGSNIRQLPLRLHQQGQLLRTHLLLWQEKDKDEHTLSLASEMNMLLINCIFLWNKNMLHSGLDWLTVMLWDFGALLLVFSLRAVNAGVKPSRDAAPRKLRYDSR